ncbi:MAG: hypothetical protein E7667_01275 [Ruminococcaceae bacterium]|nr:hypothetical protein [Oscillospiraceae bacterium]
MKITNYNLQSAKPNIDVKLAVVADLHTKDPSPVIEALKQIQPDVILSPGDMFENFGGKNTVRNQRGFAFFEQAVKIAPVYYCFGNHEVEAEPCLENPEFSGYRSVPQSVFDRLEALGIHMLFDKYESLTDGILIGGVLSGLYKKDGKPNVAFLDRYSEESGYKILLCHHPEYYPEYLADKKFDLILSGHAHGGQWRIFNRGVYAPGQGLFPKYTSGLHDGKFIISRGCSNNTRPIPCPRFFNPREVLCINIKSK